MALQDFDVGIRFKPQASSESPNTGPRNDETKMESSHWTLVVTPASGASFLVELVTDGKAIGFPDYRQHGIVFDRVPRYPLGVWRGTEEDFELLKRVHPMRGRPYSAAYNNCQHWVATYLMFMEAYAFSTSQADDSGRRRFEVTHLERRRAVHQAALSRAPGSNLLFGKWFHKPNRVLTNVRMGSAGAAALASGPAAWVAGQTTAIAAPGFWGWVGASTVAVPTTAATLALTVALPVTVVASGAVLGTYLYKTSTWRELTTFDDPRRESERVIWWGPALSSEERAETFAAVVEGRGSVRTLGGQIHMVLFE